VVRKVISVVITTFGNKKYLERSLRSVKNQTYKDIEVIVVDGKDDEKNLIILNSFRFLRPKYIGLQKDFGTIYARNTGCSFANGEYIALLDDDDEWEPTKLEKQLLYMNTPSNIGIVSCWSKLVYDDKPELNFTLKPKVKTEFKDLLTGFEMSPTSSLLVQTKAMKEVGYFSESLVFPEYDLALKILKKGYHMMSVPFPLLVYHQQAKQKKMYSKKPINLIRIIELINFLKLYHKDFWILSFKEKIYNYVRLSVLFFFLGIGGILNQNTVVILERISNMQKSRLYGLKGGA
jgi:glycosyltransferase involved in cell wall biosynthesis